VSKFNLFLDTGKHEEVGVSWEITDIREILQYTKNGDAGMWMKWRSIQKATSSFLHT
jgi:hypothetical protein